MRTGLVTAEDHPGLGEDLSIGVDLEPSPSVPAHATHKGEFEIRPGVWAYEDGVPLEILLPHLERRFSRARDELPLTARTLPSGHRESHARRRVPSACGPHE